MLLTIVSHLTVYAYEKELIMTRDCKVTKPIIELMKLTNVKCNSKRIDKVVRCVKDNWKKPKYIDRWQMPKNNDLEYLREDIIKQFQKLGLFEEKNAKLKQYDYAIIFAGIIHRMRKRIAHLAKQIDNGVEIKKIYFIGSNRIRNKSIETYVEILNPDNKYLSLKRDWKKPKYPMKNELDIMRFLFENSEVYNKLRHIPVKFVEAPDYWFLFRRRTTETVQYWYKTIKPPPGKILAISNPPYIGYKEVALRQGLPEDFYIETIGGPEASPSKQNLSVLMDVLYNWLSMDSKIYCK